MYLILSVLWVGCVDERMICRMGIVLFGVDFRRKEIYLRCKTSDMAKFLFSFNWYVDSALRHGMASRPLAEFPAYRTAYGMLSAVDNPADCYTRGLISMLRLQLDDSASEKLLRGLRLETCRAERVDFLVGHLGFLTIEIFGSVVEGDPDDTVSGFKRDMVAFANCLSDNVDTVGRILDSLQEHVSYGREFEYGQPRLLVERGMCDASESYVFTYHTFSGEKDEIESLRLAHRCGGPAIVVDGNMVWQRFADYLWLTREAPEPELMHALSFASVAAAWEVLVFDNGANCYKNMLQMVTDDVDFDHSILRSTVNRDNLLLQKVGISVRELTSEQNALTVRSRTEFGAAAREALYRSGQEALKYAIDGVDSKARSRSSHMVEIILSILTAMSVYSVVNDIYTLITCGEEVITFHFLSTSLFALATLVMVVMLVMMVRNHSK